MSPLLLHASSRGHGSSVMLIKTMMMIVTIKTQVGLCCAQARQTAVSYDGSTILACCAAGTIWQWESASPHALASKYVNDDDDADDGCDTRVCSVLCCRSGRQLCPTMAPPFWHAVRTAPSGAGIQPARISPQTLKLKMMQQTLLVQTLVWSPLRMKIDC